MYFLHSGQTCVEIQVGISMWFSTFVNIEIISYNTTLDTLFLSFVLFLLRCLIYFLVYITAICNWSMENGGSKVRLIYNKATLSRSGSSFTHIPLKIEVKRTVKRAHKCRYKGNS